MEARVRKEVPFCYRGKEIMVTLSVGFYLPTFNLGIEFLSDGLPFAKMTYQIPWVKLPGNEAILDDRYIGEDIMAFIRRYDLAEPISKPQYAHHGVKFLRFDLQKLREFDPAGVDALLDNHPKLRDEIFHS